MIEWSWRIEGRSAIVCGSWSDDDVLEAGLAALCGAAVTEIATFGKLPELAIEFSNGSRLLSFKTTEGDPAWTLFDRRVPATRWLCARKGWLIEESEAAHTQ